MTDERKWKIALIIMKVFLRRNFFGTDNLIATVDRKACSDAGFLTVEEQVKPPMKNLRFLMRRLVQTPPPLRRSIEDFPIRDAKLAYTWLMFHLKSFPVDFNTLRREIGSMAKGFGISEIQFTEFYRLLLIDIVNQELRQLEDEAPLFISERQG